MRKTDKLISACLITLLTLFLLPYSSYCYENTAPIVLGQSCAMSGPSKNIGSEVRAGFLAAFARINDKGGIAGRQIRLISLDDGYEPDRAIKNTYTLIEDDRVFMLVGEVGTPTSQAVVPIAEKGGVPFFAPFTGAQFLREPFRELVINVRASYVQEMERLVEYLVETRKFTRIACFYQNDSYGFSGLDAVTKALKKRNMDLVAEAGYERNTVAVMGAARTIHDHQPEAIVMVGAYSACAEFIKLSKTKFPGNTIFCNISFVGTESLRDALGGYGKDVVISQVVPYPKDMSLPLIRQYVADIKMYQHDAPITFTTLEGYIAGKLFTEIALKVEGELTREKFIKKMEEIGTFDLGGVVLQYGKEDHQGMDAIYLTTIYPDIRKLDPEPDSIP